MLRRGYSLIELLIVIAIIAILAGFVTVATSKSKEWALNSEKDLWRQQRKFGTVAPRSTPIRMLYIGNSYTAVNDLPRMLQTLAQAGGASPSLEYDSQLVGGATLEKHWNDGIALKKLQSETWDFVVLQEQSQLPLFDRATMLDYGKRFGNEANLRGETPLLYLTWAREAIPNQQRGLTAAYVQLAKAIQGELAPAGIAWQLCNQGSPQLRLYDADGSHPSAIGTYLTACVFYGTIYKKSPVGLPAQVVIDGKSVVNLSSDDARHLQSYAWKACGDAQKLLKGDHR